MRQGNGSDLLGLKDPRSTKIGIIYVASNDDRKSVLAAILTQEKLGRNQIAIVLPENQQNKAFQHPQDFDDLKTIRRKLRAQLIFIVPAGLGPAELARQRRFNVYSSLESYADALRAESLSAETSNKRKKDRFFGFGRKTVPLVAAAVGGAAAIALSGKKDQSTSTASSSLNGDIARNTPINSSVSDVDLPNPGQSSQDHESLSPGSEVDQVPSTPAADIDDAGVSSPTTSVASSAAGAATADIVAADLINKSAQPLTPDAPSTSMDDDWDALPPAPSTSSSQKNISVTNSALNATPPPPPASAPHTPDPVVGGTGPGIIELPSPTRTTPSRATVKLPAVSETVTATSSAQSSSTPVSRTAFQQSNTGKTAVTTIATSAPSSHGSSVSRPPVQGDKARQAGARRKKRGLGGLILAILIISALVLLCGGVASSAVGLPWFQFGLPLVSNSAPATITITPDNKLEQDSYVIQAVTSNPDLGQRQVSLRQLTFSPPSQSKSVTATGVGHVPAQTATGQLTFYNGSNQAFVVGSTTAIPGPNGVSVETDGPANIPAAHPPTEGTITVDAHATTAGANGNMASGAINETCCASGGFITVVSSDFTGGQDEQDYTYLQQSDVDGYVNQIKSTLSQQALNSLRGQLKPNEQLAGDPQCTIQLSEDQPIGDQGHNVPSANVTINATCTGLAYDASGARALAENLLKRKAVNNLGQAYALAGTIVTKQTVTDFNDGVVTLQVAVAGTWYYQFNDKQKQALASQLANKTRAAAQGFLNTYKGVAKAARIDIANGGDSLPSDPKQISIMVLATSGASPTSLPALPAAVSASPLPVSKGRG